MNVNIKRLIDNLHKTGDVGLKNGQGITRLGFSLEYFQALEVLKNLFLEAGMTIKEDEVGNLIGRIEGKKYNNKAILIGSHLDTVKNGGLYDGNLGIISGLEVIHMLKDNSIKLDHPIEVIAFNAEEGSEMGGTFGSRVMTGRQNLQEKNLEDKLKNYNLTLDNLKNSVRNMDEVGMFLELHIEQGGFLIENNYEIGVVDGIVGITRCNIKIKGESNHAGTTPMALRKDPVKIAGQVIEEINQYALKYPPPFVATVGNIIITPGMYNIIPDEVILYLEIRDLNQNKIMDFISHIEEFLKTFVDFEIYIDLTVNKPSKLLTPSIVEKFESVSKELNFKTVKMSSGAGHDAKELIYKTPTGMIFIPSIGGISHSPKEYSTEEHIKNGVEILFHAVLKLDKEREENI